MVQRMAAADSATGVTATGVATDVATDASDAAGVGSEPTLLDEQRDRARARIVKAAQRALARRGLAATVDEVADLAGVSRRTVFRHFATRERLFAAAIRAGLRTYGDHVPAAPDLTGDTAADAAVVDDAAISEWLRATVQAMHRINARNGRIYWDLSALDPELTGELAAVAAQRREARRQFALQVTRTLWSARGGRGEPPTWLADTVAVHLSGFTLQSLAGDFDRTVDEVSGVSTRVIDAAVTAALTDET
jgi:AcrR family transcriptional regulator